MPLWLLNIGGLAKRFWWIGLILLVAAILALTYCSGLGAGEAKRDKQSLEGSINTLQHVQKADEAAADARLADQARQQQEGGELQKAVNNAGNDPSQRRRAFQRCLRDQQAARAAGRPAPPCS
jgi:hypothetical protein